MGEASQTFEALITVGAAHMAANRAQEALRDAVVEARHAGASWQEIAEVLGVRKQTVWEKYQRDAGPTYHAV